MQSTVQPPAPSPPLPAELLTDYHLKIHRAQSDALDVIHQVMLHLAEGITGGKPSEEDPTQARTTTQRIRLCLQAARDILRLSPSGDGPAQPPSPAKRETVLSGAKRTKAGSEGADDPSSEARRGRMRVPFFSPPEQPHTSAAPSAQPAQAANQLLAAAGHEASRLGERIDSPPDSGLSTQDSPASALPRDSSLVAHTSPPPPPPPPPPRPQYFSDDEANQIMAVMRSRDSRLTPRLYTRILEWNQYAAAVGISPSFGINEHDLEARKPLEPIYSEAAPPG